MKWSLRSFFVVFFLLIGIGATVYIVKGYGLTTIIELFKNVDGLTLILYLLTIALLFAVLTWRWDLILRSRGHSIPYHKLFFYRIIGTAINFFTPGPRVGGEPTQAALIEKYNVDFDEGLSTVMIDKIIDTTTCGMLFIVGAIIVSFQYAIPDDAKLYMEIGGVIFISLTVLFYYRMLTNKHFMLRFMHIIGLENSKYKVIRKLEERVMKIETVMIQFYKHDKTTFILSIFITLISWIVMFMEYKLATTLLGLDLGFVQLFFIIAFVGIAVLFPIPMAVGVLEASQVWAFKLIGIAASAGVALAFLIRMKDLFYGIIGIILLGLYGFDVPKTIEKKYIKK